MKKLNEIRVIGYITNDIKNAHSPVPDNYLSSEKNIPAKLITEMKSNGWQDRDGNIWWDKEFQPEPAVGDDGNVYICLSDEDVKDPIRCAIRMVAAKKMFIDISR